MVYTSHLFDLDLDEIGQELNLEKTRFFGYGYLEKVPQQWEWASDPCVLCYPLIESFLYARLLCADLG